MKKGWAVEIEGADEYKFLAVSERGVLPVVHAQRKYAKLWRDELASTFKCRVVRVEYEEPKVVKR